MHTMLESFSAETLARGHFVVSHYLPMPFHSSRKLSGGAQRASDKDAGRDISHAVHLLEKDLCRRLWHGRRVRHRDVLSVWNKLGRLLGQSRTRRWTTDGL